MPMTELEKRVVKGVLEDEVERSKTRQGVEFADFDSMVQMLECKRVPKDYEWQSDLTTTDFAIHLLVDASIWASQYFKTRDFVSVYLDKGDPASKERSKTAQSVLNKSLNRRSLRYFSKYIRARLVAALFGRVWLKCWWDQEVREEQVGVREEMRPTGTDVMGNPMVRADLQVPRMERVQVPQMAQKILRDEFQFEVVDPRNVFTDDGYAYSAQDREWVVVRSEATLDALKKVQRANSYINLEELGEGKEETEVKAETTGADERESIASPLSPKFIVYERFGRYPVVSGEMGRLIPGFDADGKVLPDAQWKEMIITVAVGKNTKTLIRFQEQPCLDAHNQPFRPLVCGVCYIHPTSDRGLSDGRYMYELQRAVDDIFNLMNDRAMLATMPVFKGKRNSVEENDQIFMEPMHVIPLGDTNDLQEIVIKDDSRGALQQLQLMGDRMDRITSIFPTTMGALPESASTTATAIAGAESRSTLRTAFKSLTAEFTWLAEFYWIILQMTWRFAKKDTVWRMLGPQAQFFDAMAEYTYTPVSANIETEYSKVTKVKMWDQVLGRVVSIPNPKTPVLVNYIISQICQLMGQEQEDFSNALLSPVSPPQATPPPAEQSALGPEPVSNQRGLPMSLLEQLTREGSPNG